MKFLKIFSWDQNKINWSTFAETERFIWENGHVQGMLQTVYSIYIGITNDTSA